MREKIIIVILLLLIGGMLTWFFFIRKGPVPEKVIEYKYITDTIQILQPYEVPKPYRIETPPVIVTEYVEDSAEISRLRQALWDADSAFMALLESKVAAAEFFYHYPDNPKILSLELQRDTMVMGLFLRNGATQTRSWPIDLNRYNYRWNYAADLSRHPTKPPPTEPPPPLEYFVGGGVDFLWLSPYISGRIEKDFKNFRGYANINLGMLKREASTIQLGIDWKLNGKKSTH